MRSKIMTALMALAVAVGLGVGVASPAQAAWADCPDNYFCIWTNVNATGGRYQYHRDTIQDGTNNGLRLGSGISNRGYSFYNRSHVWIGIFDSNNCRKSPWWRGMDNNQYATAQGSDWGGRVSSIQLGNAIPVSTDNPC